MKEIIAAVRQAIPDASSKPPGAVLEHVLGALSSAWDAQRILWLLEANLRRLEEHRDRLRDQQN